jgi:O-antigen/teichoic acid export membrane protein
MARIFGWFKDRALRKVVKYGIPAAVGKLVMSLAGLVTMALLAHHLGAVAFGVVAMIRTFVGIVEQYANFNTWQAIIKFGTEAIATERTADVKRIIKLGVVIDLATAGIAAVVIAGVAFAVPTAFDWSTTEAAACAFYGVTVVTRVVGASDGIFRICDAYRAQAISSSISACALMAATAIAVALDANFTGCVVSLVIGEVVGNVVITLSSFKVARDRGYGGWHKATLAGTRTVFPGILRFMLATNGQLTVKKTSSELDMMIVGVMLGKASAGLFRVIKQLGTIPGRIFMPFEQVVFTELARAAAAHDYRTFMRLLRRFSALVAIGSFVVWIIAALASEPLIVLVAGDEFAPAASGFRWYLFAMVLLIANAPILRALVALGRPGTLFWFELATLAILAVSLVLGARAYGLVGVGVAVVIHRALQLAWSVATVTQIVHERERDQLIVTVPATAIESTKS